MLGEGDELLKDKVNSPARGRLQEDRSQPCGSAYIDSAGLGESRAHLHDGQPPGRQPYKLLNLTKRISDLLAITKLLTVFETYDNEADAVRSFTVAK